MNKPTTKDFEEYLEEVCLEENPRILDDDMTDFFEGWLINQEVDDYIRLANEYGKQAHEAGKQEVVEVIKTCKGHTNEGDAVVDSILQALN